MTHDIIVIEKDTAIPARFIGAIQVEKGEIGWMLRIFMTDGLPALMITFATEKTAREVYDRVVRDLGMYYAE